MIRDKIKAGSNFEGLIQREKDNVIMFEGLIRKVIEERGIDDAVKSAWVQILGYQVSALTAMYSKGEDMVEIKNYYLTILPTLERVNFTYCYVEMLWLVSIGILVDENDIDFALFDMIVKRDNIDDDFIRFMLSNKIKQAAELKGIKFEKPYQFIFDCINLSKEQAAKKLKEYLEKKWYRSHSSSGWHDTHKNESNIYSGYWSFESGAVVKILGLDDSQLMNCNYYPYDLVHWKD